jgi:hypothetical protein
MDSSAMDQVVGVCRFDCANESPGEVHPTRRIRWARLKSVGVEAMSMDRIPRSIFKFRSFVGERPTFR